MYAAYCMFNKLGKFSTAAMTLSAIILFFYPIKTEIAALHDFSTEFLFFISGILAKRHLADPKNHSIPSEATLVLFIILMGSGYFIFNNQIEPVRLTRAQSVTTFWRWPSHVYCISSRLVISVWGLTKIRYMPGSASTIALLKIRVTMWRKNIYMMKRNVFALRPAA